MDPPTSSAGITDGDSGANAAPGKEKLLFLDAANYARRFFHAHDQWSLDAAQRSVRKFCLAAQRSGWKIIAFLDQAIMTEEACAKWRKRREREIRKGERIVPQGALRLLGDMFAAEGITVHYSLEMDCDDTIARFAEADGGSILSQDRDFLRYRGATYDLYKDYRITKSKHLFLIRRDNSERRQSTSWRELGPPPKTSKHNPFRDCVEERTYLRGNPSPLVLLGNVHIHVRPLRAALYHHLQIDHPGVEEEFPVRSDTGDCVWDKQVVAPDPEFADILLTPAEAVVRFSQPRPAGASNEDWIKHQFALRAVIAEICCGALQTTLLETLKPLTASMQIPPVKKKSKQKKKKQQQPKNKQSEEPQQQQSRQTQGPRSTQQHQPLHPQHEPEQDAETKTQHSRRKKQNRIKAHNIKGRDASASAKAAVEPLSINERTRWKPRSKPLNSKDADDVKAQEPDEVRDARLLRLLLNKLTPSNLDKLVSVLLSETTMHLSNDRMRDAVVTIVTRASLDRRYAQVHAQLCERLVKDLPAPPPYTDGILTFREALGQFCLDDLTVAGSQTPEAEDSVLLQQMCRQRYIGSNRFIGELCNQGVFSVEYVQPLLDSRLQQTHVLSTDTTDKANENNEAPLEALCVILETCGECIEQAAPPGSRVVWDRCWAALNDLAEELRFSFRMKSLILDLLELRSLQWRPTRFGSRQRKEMVAKPLVERHHDHSSTATKRRRGKKGSKVKFASSSNSQDEK